jgi:uncharacterized protein (TIRG00374 family)
MTSSNEPLRPNIIGVLLVLGLIAFVVYFYFLINPAKVAEILSKTNLTVYAGAFVAYFLYVFFSSLVWRRLLKNVSVNIGTKKALLFSWVGLFFDATVPQVGWSGEISRAYLLSKDSSVDGGKIAASVVGQKLFTMTLSISALSIGLAAVLISYPLLPIVTFFVALILALSIIALLVVYYVSIKPSATKTLLNTAIRIALFFRKRWNPQSFQLKAEEVLGRFHSSIAQLRANPKGLVQPAVFAVVGFVFEISVTFLTFVALGFPVPVDKVLVVFTLTGTLQTVGVTFFGFPEIVMTSSFAALGIPLDLSFSVTLLVRVVNLWFRLIVSYAALQWAGFAIIRKEKSKAECPNLVF